MEIWKQQRDTENAWQQNKQFSKKGVKGGMSSALKQDSSVSYTPEWNEKQEGNTFSPLPTKNLNS